MYFYNNASIPSEITTVYKTAKSHNDYPSYIRIFPNRKQEKWQLKWVNGMYWVACWIKFRATPQ